MIAVAWTSGAATAVVVVLLGIGAAAGTWLDERTKARRRGSR